MATRVRDVDNHHQHGGSNPFVDDPRNLHAEAPIRYEYVVVEPLHKYWEPVVRE